MSHIVKPWYCVKGADGEVVTFGYYSFSAEQFPGCTVEKHDAEQADVVSAYYAKQKAASDAVAAERKSVKDSVVAKLEALGFGDDEIGLFRL